MLANAVSSAVERLYAAAPVGDDRGPVARVSAVSAIARLKVVGQDESDREAQMLEERDRLQHRQALTRGVLAVFESTGTSADTLGSESGVSTGDAADRQGGDPTRADPQLEEAILRFIHTMFRNLPDVEVSADGPATTTPVERAGVSREALSARIEALAQRLAAADGPQAPEAGPRADRAAGAAGAAEAPLDAPADVRDAAPSAAVVARPDASLEKAYAEVVQALRGNLSTLTQSQTTRAELISMMQRLAHAMHGAPPIDPGLPTRGGLLSARA